MTDPYEELEEIRSAARKLKATFDFSVPANRDLYAALEAKIRKIEDRLYPRADSAICARPGCGHEYEEHPCEECDCPGSVTLHVVGFGV